MKTLPLKILGVCLFCSHLLKAQANINPMQYTAQSNFWLWSIIITQSIVILAGVSLIWLSNRTNDKRRRSRSSRQPVRSEEPKSSTLFNRQDQSSDLINDRLDQLDRKIAEILKRVTEILVKLERNGQPEPLVHQHKPPQQSEVLYLKQRNGDVFNQTSTSPEGCFFQLINGQQKTARFRFMGNEDYAINNKNEVFDDVCEVSGSTLNAKKVMNVEDGTVEKQFDEKWKVTKKAKIKIE